MPQPRPWPSAHCSAAHAELQPPTSFRGSRTQSATVGVPRWQCISYMYNLESFVVNWMVRLRSHAADFGTATSAAGDACTTLLGRPGRWTTRSAMQIQASTPKSLLQTQRCLDS